MNGHSQEVSPISRPSKFRMILFALGVLGLLAFAIFLFIMNTFYRSGPPPGPPLLLPPR
jgi:hypothetical protein